MNDTYQGLNNAISLALIKAMSEDIVQQTIEKNMHDLVQSTIHDLCSWGPVRDAVRAKLEELLIPAIENYDLSDCNAKLELIINDLIEESAIADRREILKKFKMLTTSASVPKEINLSKIFETYTDYVAEAFDCSGREITDGEYGYIDIEATIIPEDNRGYSSIFEYATVRFEPVEEDDPNDSCKSLTHNISMSRYYRDDYWTIDTPRDLSVTDLRCLSSFEIFVTKLAISHTKILLDETSFSEEVAPKSEPEIGYI